MILLDRTGARCYLNLRTIRKFGENGMSKYKTKQRAMLLDDLEKRRDERFTARELADACAAEGISVSAVYRNLSELEEEGKVMRVSMGRSRETYYRFSDADACRGEIHLSCTKCGRTFHMARPDAALIESRLAENEGFAIDRSSTVLYGLCSGCREDAK